VANASGKVGPPLEGIAGRVYLGGVLPNTPENMASFIRAPHKADPRTAMPDMGVTEAHARDMVAYLYTLK
jgi:cytochrome c2